MNSPSTHGPNGRFQPGNKLGKGNPLAGRAAKIRAELLKSSSKADVKAICRKLIDGAKGGDLAFIKEWFDRTAGRPTDILTEHRITEIEQAIQERQRE